MYCQPYCRSASRPKQNRVWAVKVPFRWWNAVAISIKFIMSVFSHSCNSRPVFKCSQVTVCWGGAEPGKWCHTVRLSCTLQPEWIMIVISTNPGQGAPVRACVHKSLSAKDDLSNSLTVGVSMISGTTDQLTLCGRPVSSLRTWNLLSKSASLVRGLQLQCVLSLSF